MGSRAYVLVAIVVLGILGALVLVARRSGQPGRLTPLASLGIGFIMVGVVFGDDRLVGYSLIGAGVALAVADMIRRSRVREA